MLSIYSDHKVKALNFAEKKKIMKMIKIDIACLFQFNTSF